VLLHAPSEPRRESLRLRLNVWRCRPRLDEALAEGADPGTDETLALRARQLVAPTTRSAIARTLGNLLDAADEPVDSWGGYGPRPPLQREQVLAARDGMCALADELTRPSSVSPQAVALAARLVWDSSSPIYARDSEASVARWIDTVLDLI
jgi:hypothetical protein